MHHKSDSNLLSGLLQSGRSVKLDQGESHSCRGIRDKGGPVRSGAVCEKAPVLVRSASPRKVIRGLRGQLRGKWVRGQRGTFDSNLGGGVPRGAACGNLQWSQDTGRQLLLRSLDPNSCRQLLLRSLALNRYRQQKTCNSKE